jgi:hypothetical protein
MSAEMADKVMRRLSTPGGPLAKQNLVLSAQNEKMERMYTMLLLLTGNQQMITATITPSEMSPTRTPREQDSTQTTNTIDSCPSPDRKLIRLGAHPDVENGAQME